MKQITVIGLGQFGSHLARQLASLHCEVLAVDSSERRVAELRDHVHQAVICDARDLTALKAIVSADCDEAIVSLGESMEPSILCTLHLHQIGVRKIRCKAVSEDHALILRSIGAHEIIFPERETAERTARRVAYPSLVDYFPFEEDHRIMEIQLPKKLDGKKLAETGLRSEYHLLVLATKRADTGEFRFIPAADDVVRDGDTLIVLGREINLARLLALG
ncbi:MAG: TrkA family potassium uptake protein [Phycisphaerales bacterium]|nr:TrkA family potassium uptake protein [Phycisphaerales bacterium]